MPSQAFYILNSLGKSHIFPGEPYFFEGLTREKTPNKTKNSPYPYNVQVTYYFKDVELLQYWCQKLDPFFLSSQMHFFVCDAKNDLGEWDELPAALSVLEMDMKNGLLLSI